MLQQRGLQLPATIRLILEEFLALLATLPASAARSTNTGVRLFLPALMASAGPGMARTVKPITVSYTLPMCCTSSVR